MAKAKKSTKKQVRARTSSRVKRTKRSTTRRVTAKSTRNRASASAKEAAAGRMAGPSIPLRDLVRDGMPRSPKAHRGLGVGLVPAGPQVRRRMKTAHGLKMGSVIAQNMPRRPESVGAQRMAGPRR